MLKYSHPTIALLCLLLRLSSQDHYHIPLTPVVDDLLVAFSTALHKEQGVTAALHRLLCGLWLTRWHRSSGNHFPCPTERLLILFTLKPDGGHLEPKDITGYLAKFQYCIRLTCLREVLSLSTHQFDGDQLAACESILPWFTEKTTSSFSRIRFLQHYASSVAFKTMGLPNICWVDRTEWKVLLYKGDRIHLNHLRAMFEENRTTIIDIWEKKVLKGLTTRITYDHIADSLGNTQVDYSFLNDPRNTCFNDRDTLANAFMADPIIRKSFGRFHQGKMTWNHGALLQWLRDYAEFQAQLLIRCEMLSGAPGRGTELTPMSFCNTKYRSRNLIIMDKHVTILRRYNKMGSISGQDKLIPHSLDCTTGDLMIQSLALARPFAELAVYLCMQNRRDTLLLYKSHIFINVDRLFDTNDLSNAMARMSLQHVACKLTVNPWRHISIAFKRKLAHYTEDLLDLDENETVDALQAGHSRATENRIYGLSPDALSGPAEDLLPHFLQASVKWQLIMHTMPGGLGLSYDQTDSPQFQHLAKSGQFGMDVQKDVLGHLQPQRTTLSEEKIANRIVEKIQDDLGANIETRILDKIAVSICPIIESAVREAISMSSNSLKTSTNRDKMVAHNQPSIILDGIGELQDTKAVGKEDYHWNNIVQIYPGHRCGRFNTALSSALGCGTLVSCGYQGSW